ncbi:hypothetical protein PAXRUDRAFT_173812, partial [Paxillus rubicundulus Ve08.2h10]
LPKSFWADAMATAAYISAQSLTSALHGENPYQTLFCQHDDPTFFRPFSCPTYAHILKEQCRGKFCSHGWNRHVTFDETGTISACNLAPWNVPTIEGQWEGLLPRQCKAEHEEVVEETLKLRTLDLCRTVGVDNAPPDAPEAQQPPSPTIYDLTNHFEQLHMDPPLAPAPAPVHP